MQSFGRTVWVYRKVLGDNAKRHDDPAALSTMGLHQGTSRSSTEKWGEEAASGGTV